MKQTLFVGNYSNHGIDILDFDETNCVKISETNDLVNLSYICKNENNLYSVVEIDGDNENDSGYVTHYKFNNKKIQFISKKSSLGKGPCFLLIDTKRNILFVSNYSGGSLSAFQLNNDGKIGKKIYYKYFGKNSKVHHVQLSNDYNKLYVSALGIDTVFEYKIVYSNNFLDLKEISKINFSSQTEPRHLAINMDNNIFLVTEHSCELYKISHDLKIFDKMSILPNGIDINSSYTGCAIKIDSEFKYMYISVRGHNSISVFDIQNNGIKLIQNTSCHGQCPRDISFDKTGKFLLCANQTSNDISVFSINNGLLNFVNKNKLESPSCIVVDSD